MLQTLFPTLHLPFNSACGILVVKKFCWFFLIYCQMYKSFTLLYLGFEAEFEALPFPQGTKEFTHIFSSIEYGLSEFILYRI